MFFFLHIFHSLFTWLHFRKHFYFCCSYRSWFHEMSAAFGIFRFSTFIAQSEILSFVKHIDVWHSIDEYYCKHERRPHCHARRKWKMFLVKFTLKAKMLLPQNCNFKLNKCNVFMWIGVSVKYLLFEWFAEHSSLRIALKCVRRKEYFSLRIAIKHKYQRNWSKNGIARSDECFVGKNILSKRIKKQQNQNTRVWRKNIIEKVKRME